MTIVELLVAGTALTVIMGIAFGMMIESEKTSRRLSGHEFLVQECEQALLKTSRLVQGAVAPQNLTGLANQSMLTPVFTANRLTLLAYDQEGGDFLNQVSIETAGNGVVKMQPIAETAGAMTARVRETPLLDAAKDDYSTSMSFSFAKASAPGASPDYRAEWPADQWPDLVRIVVTARSKNPGEPAIRLATAVIPGGISGNGEAKPAAAAAVAPAAPPPVAGGPRP